MDATLKQVLKILGYFDGVADPHTVLQYLLESGMLADVRDAAVVHAPGAHHPCRRSEFRRMLDLPPSTHLRRLLTVSAGQESFLPNQIANSPRIELSNSFCQHVLSRAEAFKNRHIPAVGVFELKARTSHDGVREQLPSGDAFTSAGVLCAVLHRLSRCSGEEFGFSREQTNIFVLDDERDDGLVVVQVYELEHGRFMAEAHHPLKTLKAFQYLEGTRFFSATSSYK